MQLGSLFTDGAVLQRECRLPVWGKAGPGELIHVSLGEEESYAVSSAEGAFLAYLPPLPAGGPHVLTVENTVTGERIERNDILIGEVWLASGQSNMEYRLRESPAQFTEFKKELRNAELLRCFTVPRMASGAQETSCGGCWQKAREEFTPEFSAVASWFSLRLQEKLQIPVGIIHSSWGGTIVEAWSSRETLLQEPDTREFWENYLKKCARPELWQPASRDPEVLFAPYADPGNKGEKDGWADPGFSDADWTPFLVPGSWLNRHLGGNGACWFRCHIQVPAEWLGKKLVLELGGVDKTDVTYFNGVKVGATGSGFDTQYWNQMRKYTVPARVNNAPETVIAVRAFSFAMDGSMSGAHQNYRLYPEGRESQAIPLAGPQWLCRMERDFGRVTSSQWDCAPGLPNSPAILFDGMIRPLIPYAMRGVIWYQGESNSTTAGSYCRKLSTMIRDWRFRWGLGDFPFLIVQLANFREPEAYFEGSDWARLRQAQLEVTATVPNTALAVAIDVGDAADIHPADKRTVGERLALAALQDVYGKTAVTGHSPTPVKAECSKEGLITIRFRDTGSTLTFRGRPRGFYVAGSDGKYLEAPVSSFGPDSVTLKSPVPDPSGIRYAWADNPQVTLFGGSGLPASPFEWKL